MLEQRGRHVRHISAVVDNENRLPLRMPCFCSSRGELFAGDLLVCTRRQIDCNRCSLSDLAFCLYGSTGLVRKAINLRQTEPGSFANLFGCEKWIEHLGQKIGRNTSAGITKRYREEIFPKATIASFLIYGHGVDG